MTVGSEGSAMPTTDEESAQRDVDDSMGRTDVLIDKLVKEHDELRRALDVRLELARKYEADRKKQERKNQSGIEDRWT